MTRTYQMHGQTTKVSYSKYWKTFIIDCGSLWLKHDLEKDLYKQGVYREDGVFTSLRWISREEFLLLCRQALKNLNRVTTI